ncbi:MAG: alpha/beta hydrolase [Myxococcota bacterium]|nr:alpha/beta hydrolase [Myxococcota bacterium]
MIDRKHTVRSWSPILLTLIACDPVEGYHKHLHSQFLGWGFERGYYDTENGRVAYWVKRTGEQEPLVLLHGFGGNGTVTWYRILGRLSKDRPMLIPDLLWFGESHSMAAPTLSAQSDAVQSILQQMAWEKYDLLGTSYGGFVALALVERHSLPIDQLFLVDSPGPYFSSEDIEALHQRFGVNNIHEILVPQNPKGVQNLIDICYYKKGPSVPMPILASEYKRSFAKYHNEKRMLLDDLISRRMPLKSTMSPIEQVHVYWGEFDRIFPLSSSKAIAERFQADITVFPNAAHAPYIQYPQRFVAHLMDDLNTE